MESDEESFYEDELFLMNSVRVGKIRECVLESPTVVLQGVQIFQEDNEINSLQREQAERVGLDMKIPASKNRGSNMILGAQDIGILEQTEEDIGMKGDGILPTPTHTSSVEPKFFPGNKDLDGRGNAV